MYPVRLAGGFTRTLSKSLASVEDEVEGTKGTISRDEEGESEGVHAAGTTSEGDERGTMFETRDGEIISRGRSGKENIMGTMVETRWTAETSSGTESETGIERGTILETKDEGEITSESDWENKIGIMLDTRAWGEAWRSLEGYKDETDGIDRDVGGDISRETEGETYEGET